jgi:ATP-dependent RNA helicase RhlB
VLVATDIAARGIDIAELPFVINYELPHTPEDYVHRIGRTACAGRSGDAVSFACERYVFALPEIEAYIGRKLPTAKLDVTTLPALERPVGGRRPEASGRDDRGRGRRDRGGRSARPRDSRREPARPPVNRAVAATPPQEPIAVVPAVPAPPAIVPVPSVVVQAPSAVVPVASKRASRPLRRRGGFEKPAVG